MNVQDSEILRGQGERISGVKSALCAPLHPCSSNWRLGAAITREISSQVGVLWHTRHRKQHVPVMRTTPSCCIFLDIHFSLKHVLQAEIALRREREVEVQRLRGALRHLLADGEDLHNTTKAAPAIGNSGGLSQASTEGAPEDTLRHRQISCSQSDHQWGQHLEQVENATLATNEDLVEGESGR